MNKKFTQVLVFCLLLLFFSAPFMIKAAGLVPDCGAGDCDWANVKGMLVGILDKLVNYIAMPLAVLAVTAGAIMLLLSAGNPTLAGLGKKTIISALVGFLLAYCTKQIINFVLNAMGSKYGL